MLRIRVLDGPGALDPVQWNSIGADPLSRHEILSAIVDARLPGVRLRLAVVEDARGRLVAGAPLSCLDIDGARLTRGAFQRAIHAARRVRHGFLRTRIAMCGTPLSVGNPPVRIARSASVESVLRGLGEVVMDVADTERASWRVFKEFVDPAGTAELARAGWSLVPSEPDFALRCPWRKIEDYLESLRHPYRYKIRKSGRKLSASGVRISDAPLAAAYDETLHRLYENVFAHAEVQLEHLNHGFFTALGRRTGDRARLLRFDLDGRTVGWVALLWSDRTLIDLFHGIDYRVNGSIDLYFNQLAAVVRYGIERGATEIRLGQSCETVKTRFGASAEPRWIALRHSSPVVNHALRRGRSVLFPVRAVPVRMVFHEPVPLPEVTAHADSLRGQSAGSPGLVR